MLFVKVDGTGDPNSSTDYRTAVEWLFGVSSTTKFAPKDQLNRDYVVLPLEAPWWA